MNVINPQQIIADAQRQLAQGRVAEGEALLRQLLALTPDNPELLHHIGLLCHRQRNFAEAERLIGRAIAINAGKAQFHVNFGEALRQQGKCEPAIESYRRAIQLQPNFALAYFNLGVAFRQSHRLGEAIDAYRQSIHFNPNDERVYNNLGTALRAQGRVNEALPALRRALEIEPTSNSHSNLLYAMWFDPDSTPPAILAEHARFVERWAAPLAREIRPHLNDRTPDRRIRIGYVSPDFRQHVIGLFMLPILQHRDRAVFEVFCYADVAEPDFMTERLRADADTWVQTTGMTDAALAERIRSDGIDILVDLTAHMARNRMLAFARKPAPVQVSYLAYAGTTGLPTMDYRLSDIHLDPENFETFGTEQVVRLPVSYWCYQPAIDLPAAAPSPIAACGGGSVTFACLNTCAKVNPAVIALWSRILKALPDARLRLIVGGGPSGNDHLVQSFAQLGVAPSKIELLDLVPYEQYFSLYAEVDIALDPFPYNGGTTTLDALYMGVPVITLAGTSGMSRAGVSILTNARLPELIAATPDDYVDRAVELARDVRRLITLRQGLRERLSRSPLMDAPHFMRKLERAYRAMWQNYCK